MVTFKTEIFCNFSIILAMIKMWLIASLVCALLSFEVAILLNTLTLMQTEFLKFPNSQFYQWFNPFSSIENYPSIYPSKIPGSIAHRIGCQSIMFHLLHLFVNKLHFTVKAKIHFQIFRTELIDKISQVTKVAIKLSYLANGLLLLMHNTCIVIYKAKVSIILLSLKYMLLKIL